ncbi:hypothetical protein RclHR1_06570003 [Rhizophagus clarus]|uniref:G-protein coupled receptors family 1 profile domain-containing protein n=1 Tax=Rhizophagus clarus TaxID=94130 RepID=A0A2Z6SJ71_9GLOM|nr:hypothetical protein RclHR1_06570003 [Rhizophagus clarus]GES97084.1 hypothetical protein GLOIN_2v1871002 [Rhizophagus clarus]
MNNLIFLLFISFIPSTIALQDKQTIFNGSNNIESVFDAATGFMIPLIIYLSLNKGMNGYLFCALVILAVADMSLTTLFTYFCYFYRDKRDPFFWIYFSCIEPIYIINYLLILKESKYFNNSCFKINKEENSRGFTTEKFIKKKLIPLTLYIINFIFLCIAINHGYVDFINGLFIIIPGIILFIVYIGFVIFYKEETINDDESNGVMPVGMAANNKKRIMIIKSNGLAHLRFLVEFMCSIIFVMISGPSVLWIKSYLSISIVELTLYLEMAKPKQEKSARYRISNLDQCRNLLLNFNNNDSNDGSEKSNDYVIEFHVKDVKGQKDVQFLSLEVTNA